MDKQGGSTLGSYSYGRDALGQLSSSADPLDGTTHTYGYSPLTQLTTAQQSNGKTTSWTACGVSQLPQRFARQLYRRPSVPAARACSSSDNLA